jgi:radical SAM protein (TIGR01212 family)
MWQGGRRYYARFEYDQKTFQCRVMKAVVDGNFSCPNLDGTKGTGGCIFCAGGSGYFTQTGTIAEQLQAERTRIHAKFPQAKLIAYFQAHTNTYAPLSYLQTCYETALQQPDVIGLSIGTRPDCLPEEVLAYLEALSHRTALTVELGLQTLQPKTAQLIHRCYENETFLEAFHALKQRNIRVCVHLINGLPQESTEQMLDNAIQLGKLRPDAVKLQLLHVIENTPLAEWYQRGGVQTMTQEDYVALVAEQLTYFPPETVIERLTGDGDAKTLIAPLWSRKKRAVLNAIAQYQKAQNLYQGMRFIPAP